MDGYPFEKKVEDYTIIEDSKAGLKQVYIITTSNNEKYVYSEGSEGGWNWLSEEYIEPIATKWIKNRKPELAPKVINYDRQNSKMLTEYIGDKDLSDIKITEQKMRSIGETIGEIHSIQDIEGFGGFDHSSGKLTTQHENWNKTLQLLVDKIVLPTQSMKNKLKQKVEKLETENVQPRISHGDLRPDNFRVNRDNKIIALIDWQNAWSSDGLLEFLYRRLKYCGLMYENSRQITDGYISKTSEDVLNYSDRHATISLLIAVARYYKFEKRHQQKIRRFFDRYGALGNTINLETILDPEKNIDNYL